MELWNEIGAVGGVLSLMLAFAVVTLWTANQKLQKEMKERDEANLLTLQAIRLLLNDVKLDGGKNTQQVKDHIDRSIDLLREGMK